MIENMGIEELLALRIELAAEIWSRKDNRKRKVLDKGHQRKIGRAVRGAMKIMDRRRFIIGPVPSGRTRTAPPDATGSVYPDMVRDPDGSVLKDGRNVQKLGGDVLVGDLKGARLFFIALEERATCPRSCAWWEGCYTNNMPLLVRYRHGTALQAAITAELRELFKNSDRILVRLHMSGDFYSVAYVRFWRSLLETFPGLHAFGFTAHPDDTVIGAEIAAMRDLFRGRFAIRTSGRTGRWGSFTVPLMAEDRAMIGDAVVCPEQRDAMAGFKQFTHCGSCGLCWKADRAGEGRPIAFIEH
jgi:hypothetical protein